MTSVSITVLKARLSQFLESVRRGHEVLITDRGRPVAKIVPLSTAREHEDGRIAELERAGLVRVGLRAIPKGFWQLPRPLDAHSDTRAALIAERAGKR
jgi:prevent-host-death family protein